MPETPSVVKSVRLSRGLLDRLGTQAKAEHRTVNNLIAAILTDGLDQRLTVSTSSTPAVDDALSAPDSKDTLA